MKSRNSREDVATLRQFCELDEEHGDLERAVRTFDIDKFRPLSIFLQKEDRNPERRTIELLAWLLNFSPRPYQLNTDYSTIELDCREVETSDEDLADIDEGETDTIRGGSGDRAAVGTARPDLSSRVSASNFKNFWSGVHTKRLAGGVCLAFIAILLAILWPAKCMYWSGVQYESADCDQKLPYIPTLPADQYKINYFKQITRPDTITREHISKVWYWKINGKLELYTHYGEHPEYPGKYLKPLTKYMYEEYVLTGKVSVL